MEQTKHQPEIIKDDKVYKHIDTSPSRTGREGYFTDTYKSLDGQLLFVERLCNAIRFSKEPRNNSEGAMNSFKRNFNRVLPFIAGEISEKQLNTYILQLKYPIEKAKQYFEEKDKLGVEAFTKALEEKIEEVVEENSELKIIEVFEKILGTAEIKNNTYLNNALILQVYKFKNPEAFKTEEDDKETTI